MRLLIAAGGTGGHVYPALAPMADLARLDPTLEVLWIGTQDGMEADLVEREGLKFQSIRGRGVAGVGAVKALLAVIELGRGFLQARKIVRDFQPDALFVTGGYTSVAVTVACWLRNVPIAVYLPDIEPGRGVKFVAKYAKKVLVTDQNSAQYFPDNTVIETGYPLRPALIEATALEQSVAREHFKLAPDKATLFVFGGSRGARSLNTVVRKHLQTLTDTLNLQVIHITGTLDWPKFADSQQTLPAQVAANYVVFPYLHDDMGVAMAAADIVCARAGASTLGEFPAFGLSAILVPYPHAWRYQKVNADTLVSQGSGIRIDDADLDAELVPTLQRLLATPSELAAMRNAAKAQAKLDAAHKIAKELLSLPDA